MLLQQQASVLLGYINGFFNEIPMLNQMVKSRTFESIQLVNRVEITVSTASYRTIRGFTCVGAVLDELAFWPTEDSADPDREILVALRPAMATVPNALLLAVSSPYSRRGELWRNFKEHYGKDDSPVLVLRAPSRAMNPTPNPLVVRA